MKTVYLVRHGKAVSRDTDIPDFERSLIKRGENDALQVAKRLGEKKINPSLIISSPALRAFETARIFAKQLDYRLKAIRTRKAIYDQAEGGLLTIVHTVSDENNSIMLVGHSPLMDDFARFLTQDFKESIPTSGVVGIEFNTNTWKDISRCKGELKLFYFPKQTQKTETKKPDIKELEKKLTEQIVNVLKELDTVATEKIEKPVKKSSKKIAKIFVKKMKRIKLKN